MTRLLPVLIFNMMVIFVSCGQIHDSKDQDKPADTFRIDTSKIAVLPYDTAYYFIKKGNKATALTNEDLKNIELILTRCINEYNPKQEIEFQEISKKYPDYEFDKIHFVIDMARYKRQYIATINAKGEKEVWVNCFCGFSHNYWRKSPVFVMDGGNCYFNLIINLSTGEYYDMMVNGVA